jgi:hypothetical protein
VDDVADLDLHGHVWKACCASMARAGCHSLVG